MKLIKISFIFSFFLLIIHNEALAQIFRNDTTSREQQRTDNSKQASWRDRIRLGGNFGAQFGTITFINVSPLVMYQVSEQVQLGVGATYQYTNFNNFLGLNGSNSIYGGRTFARFFVMPGIFAQAECEMLNTRYFDSFAGEVRRDWIPAAFLGGGYSQSAGGRAAFNVTILYNFLYEQYKNRTFYASPWVFRVGFTL
jgi:hypothetical protein